jgi:hypothetical protein
MKQQAYSFVRPWSVFIVLFLFIFSPSLLMKGDWSSARKAG